MGVSSGDISGCARWVLPAAYCRVENQRRQQAKLWSVSPAATWLRWAKNTGKEWNLNSDATNLAPGGWGWAF